ncbi:MAG TPA: helix-turn-helix transcriptional regulator [Actinomycetota bacterium]
MKVKVRNVGEFIREQRRSAQLSLRKLAAAAGVSNPYLSQIERGLRRPSAEMLQAIAKGLRISAETLYVRAGILDEDRAHDVVGSILADQSITERQKQALVQIYDSFRAEAAADRAKKRTVAGAAARKGSAGGRGTKNDPKPSPGSSSSSRRQSKRTE